MQIKKLQMCTQYVVLYITYHRINTLVELVSKITLLIDTMISKKLSTFLITKFQNIFPNSSIIITITQHANITKILK